MAKTRIRSKLDIATAALALLVVTSACYLPTSDVERSVESQVLVAVYRCSAAAVAGDITNDNDVPIVVTILPRWLDANRTPFHAVDAESFEIRPGSAVEWEVPAGEDIERPQFCEAETVSVEISN